MKIAIAHDFLQQYGGAEKIFSIFTDLFPNSELYALVYDKSVLPAYKKLNIKTSFINQLPFAKKNHYYYLPFYPFIINSLKINCDILLTSNYAFVKNIKSNGIHICYCHSTMRFAHGFKDSYLKKQNPIIKFILNPIINWIAKWDIKNTKNTDFFIANSINTKQNIQTIYNRESTVIYPPIDTKRFNTKNKVTQDYYLIVSRLVLPYKQIDLAVKAFNKLNKKLIIIGTGRDEKYIKKIARPNIQLIGEIRDIELLSDYYKNAKALIFPSNDDFGMTSLEAQACGTPVIAYSKGGALETVIEGKTGHFFRQQSPQSLIKSIKDFEGMKFNPYTCRKNALKYDKEIFITKIRHFINQKTAKRT